MIYSILLKKKIVSQKTIYDVKKIGSVKLNQEIFYIFILALKFSSYSIIQELFNFISNVTSKTKFMILKNLYKKKF